METALQDFLYLLALVISPVLILLASISMLINLILATIQLQEQSVATVVKLAIIFSLVYLFGDYFMSELANFCNKVLEYFHNVGDTS
ncbi:MAG: flagellar biosynthetic protein FliQ [Deltaproteobacteria bacterium]|nr:flagellar biosynthetic protein FliQ [Deltaproteobacteria bacterium]